MTTTQPTQTKFWKDITIGALTLKANGVVMFPARGKLRIVDGEMALGWLRDIEEMSPFYQGAIWDRLKTDHPETYAQVLADVGPSRGNTLDEYARVHRAIPPSDRREALDWSHHQAVAALTPRDRKRVLDKVEAQGLNLSATRQEARLIRRKVVAQGQSPLEGQYRVILVDPEYRETDNTIEAISKWAVLSHAAPNAAVFIRHYEHQRFEVQALLDAWKLTHKRTLIWDRLMHQGPDGYGIEARTDYVLLAVRGKLSPDRTIPMVSSIHQCKSEGPVPIERIQEVAAQLYDGPYLMVTAHNEMVPWEQQRRLHAV